MRLSDELRRSTFQTYRRAEAWAAGAGIGRAIGPGGRAIADRLEAFVRRAVYPIHPTSYTVGDLVLTFPTDGYFGTEIGPHGYEASTTRLFRKCLEPGMTVVDVGAHVGHYSLVAARGVAPNGLVHAFEPDPLHLQCLTSNITQNQLDDLVRVVPAAVADHDGTAVLHLGRRDHVANSLIPTEGTSRHSIQCNVVSLDSYFSILDWPSVDIIKIDIEGAEYAALQGMQELLRRNRDVIIFMELFPANLHAAHVTLPDLWDRLQQLGLTYVAVISKQLVRLRDPNDVKLTLAELGIPFANVYCAAREPSRALTGTVDQE